MEIDFLVCPWCTEGLLYRRKCCLHSEESMKIMSPQAFKPKLSNDTERLHEVLCDTLGAPYHEEMRFGCTNDPQCDGKTIVQSDSSLAFSGMSYDSIIESFFKAFDNHKLICSLPQYKGGNDACWTTTENSDNFYQTKMHKYERTYEQRAVNVNASVASASPSTYLGGDSMLNPLWRFHSVLREQPLLFTPCVSTHLDNSLNSLCSSDRREETTGAERIRLNTPVFYFLECSAGKETLKTFIL